MEKEPQQSFVHTPGPWKYVEGAQVVIAHEGQMRVADIRGFDYLSPTREELDRGLAEMDANGRLLAAAPELLSACRKFIELFRDSDMRPEDECHELFGLMAEVVNKAV